MSEFDKLTKEQQEAWKELVIARLRALPDNVRISIGYKWFIYSLSAIGCFILAILSYIN